MKEQIKKWVHLIAECMVLGFAVSFGMCLCDDGRFPEERIKGKTKRWLGKWSRKKIRMEMEREQNERTD